MHTVYIGLGSNLASSAGPPEATMAAAALRLASVGSVVARSSLYSTEPVGFADQPRFLNAVIQLETDLDPRSLLASLLRIEQEFGRDRTSGIRNGPRTLDLDILVFGDQRINDPGLQIPHPRIGERAFVVIPLLEIASKSQTADMPQAVSQLLKKSPQASPGTSHAVVALQSAVWHPYNLRADGASGGA